MGRIVAILSVFLFSVGYLHAQQSGTTYSDDALSVSSAINERYSEDYVLDLMQQSIAYLDQDDVRKAIGCAKQAYKIAQKTPTLSSETQLMVYTALCLCGYQADDRRLIEEFWPKLFYLQRSEIIEQLGRHTSALRYEAWREHFVYLVEANRMFSVKVREREECVGVAYNSLLLSKGLLLSSETEFERAVKQSTDADLQKEYHRLKQMQSSLRSSSSLLSPAVKERMERSAQELESSLMVRVQQSGNYAQIFNIKWQDVQSRLSDEDVAIEIMDNVYHDDSQSHRGYVALVLRKGWKAPRFVALCAENIIGDACEQGPKIYNGAESKHLYNLLWGRLEPYLKDGDNVYISAADLLHQLNFEVLESPDGRRANERYNVRRVSSTKELCVQRDERALVNAVLYGNLKYDVDSKTMALSASEATKYLADNDAVESLVRAGIDELPATEREILSIGRVLEQRGIRTRLLMRSMGSEESFKALSGRATSILHIATHGFYHQDTTWQQMDNYWTERALMINGTREEFDAMMRTSGLILSGGAAAWRGERTPEGLEDGVLYAEEIATLDLSSTELVVLSACETALGVVFTEGVMGLQRAFKSAGVRSIIMSLWEVNDAATALFMRTFYEQWLGGASRHQAFVAAQRRVRQQYGPQDSSWAAFIMLD